jgi:hypothetical protein
MIALLTVSGAGNDPVKTYVQPARLSLAHCRI